MGVMLHCGRAFLPALVSGPAEPRNAEVNAPCVSSGVSHLPTAATTALALLTPTSALASFSPLGEGNPVAPGGFKIPGFFVPGLFVAGLLLILGAITVLAPMFRRATG